MKKKIVSVITLLIAVTFGFTLAACAAGPQGERGEQGLQGIQGEQGLDGRAGEDGVDGEKGDKGDKGENGKDGASDVAKILPFDYYVQTYGVDYGHIFKTLTVPDFDLLLRGSGAAGTSGRFAVLFGGAWDGYTAALIRSVNTAAKDVGIGTVFVLDTYYDGKIGETLSPLGSISQQDIAGLSTEVELGHKNVTNGTAGRGYSLTQIINAFDDSTSIDAEEVLTGEGSFASAALLTVIDVPFAASARNTNLLKPKLVSYYQNTTYDSPLAVADDIFTNPKRVKDFQDGIAEALSGVGNGEGYFDPFVQRGAATHLKEIQGFTANEYFQTVSYAELLALLAHPGDHAVFFGAFQCPNAQAIYRPLYETALQEGFTGKIYVFDATLENTNSSNANNIRHNSASGQYAPRLYAHLLDTFFAGYESRYNVQPANHAANGHFQAAANIDVSENASAVSVGGVAYARIVLPAVFLYNNAVTSNVVSESKAGAEVSKGGVIDIFEAELRYIDGTIGTGASGANAQKEYAYKYFSLLLQKYGVAQELIANGFAVSALRNGTAQNKAIGTGVTPASITGTAAIRDNAAVTATSATLNESGFGLNVRLSAVKGNENINIVYNYFADEAAVQARINGNAAGAGKTVLQSYVTSGEHTAGTLSALGSAASRSGGAVYYGTKGAIDILQDIFGA